MTDLPAAAGSGRAPGGAEPGLIRRHGLVAALDRAAQKRVTIISAPAGTGKTSLLRAWANQPGQADRIAFMTVRPGQHDMQLFWLSMLGAVRAAAGTSKGGAQLPPVAPGSSGLPWWTRYCPSSWSPAVASSWSSTTCTNSTRLRPLGSSRRC